MLKGHQSWVFDSKPTILSSAAVGGPFEGNGALLKIYGLVKIAMKKRKKRFLNMLAKGQYKKQIYKKKILTFSLVEI